MRGNIYTRQKCPVCNGKMINDERRQGCYCLKHKKVAATNEFYLKFGRNVRIESKSYKYLSRELTALRHKVDKNEYDPRDYKADKPLAFNNLISEYLEEKEKQDLKAIQNVRHYVYKVSMYFGDQNIKGIRKRQINQFLRSLKVSKKTQANYLSTISDFFTWLVDEEIIFRRQAPEMPKIEYDLGWRKITDWENQDIIIDKLHELTWGINPKIWLGIDMLRTYVNIRPGDLYKLTEGDIDLETGIIMIWRPTKRKDERKTVRLVPDHIELIAEMKKEYPALPHVKFFRHTGGLQSIKPGQTFGNKYFYKWWKKACEELNIEGLDLYGGTRHTTTTELAKRFGREAAKDANENRTNKAFDRYCQMQGDRAHEMALKVRRKGKAIPHHIPTTKKA